MTKAFPLHWPLSQKRTERRQRNAAMRATVTTACADIEDEVRRLNGVDLVVSTNLQLRIDGFPRSGQAEPRDPGVAVYFKRRGKSLVFACDRYTTVAQNLRAVALHLDAIRGMERWGVGSLDQAFAGYQALPETSETDPWWKVLGCEDPPRDGAQLQVAYRAAAHRSHPDMVGGSEREFVRVQRAYQAGREALGVA